MIRPVGKITVPVAGTIRSVYDLAQPLDPDTFKFKAFQAVLLQALPTNTGKVYIGNASMVKATYVGVSGVLVIPSSSNIPSWGASHPLSPAGVDLTALYLDVDVSGEGVLLSVLIS